MTVFILAESGPATRVELTGRLDSAGVEQVEASLAAALAGVGRPVLFDMSKVAFVGSLGIRLLIASGRALQKRGLPLLMFGVQPQVAEVFETVALSDLIPVLGTEDAALAELT